MSATRKSDLSLSDIAAGRACSCGAFQIDGPRLMPTRHEMWCWALGVIIGAALAGSLVWSFQAPPPEWYHVEHLADWFVAVFTGLLVMETLFLVISTNKLWKSDERRFGLEQRPWLSLSLDAPRGFYCDGQTVVLEFSVIGGNIGKTPAFDVHVLSDAHVEGVSSIAMADLQTAPRPERGKGDVLFPGQQLDPPAHKLVFKISDIKEDPGFSFVASIAVCVFYEDSAGRDCRTGVVYLLTGLVPEYPAGTHIMKPPGVLFHKIKIGGSFAT